MLLLRVAHKRVHTCEVSSYIIVHYIWANNKSFDAHKVSVPINFSKVQLVWEVKEALDILEGLTLLTAVCNLSLKFIPPIYSVVKDSSADLRVNFKTVQNRPTVKAVCTKISKKFFCIFFNIFIFLRENKEVSFFIFWIFKLKQP